MVCAQQQHLGVTGYSRESETQRPYVSDLGQHVTLEYGKSGIWEGVQHHLASS